MNARPHHRASIRPAAAQGSLHFGQRGSASLSQAAHGFGWDDLRRTAGRGGSRFPSHHRASIRPAAAQGSLHFGQHGSASLSQAAHGFGRDDLRRLRAGERHGRIAARRAAIPCSSAESTGPSRTARTRTRHGLQPAPVASPEGQSRREFPLVDQARPSGPLPGTLHRRMPDASGRILGPWVPRRFRILHPHGWRICFCRSEADPAARTGRISLFQRESYFLELR